MTYVELAKNLNIKLRMVIILLRNQERMKKAAIPVAAVDDWDIIPWD